MELRGREYYGIFVLFWWGYVLGRLGEHYAIGVSPIDFPIGTTIGLFVGTVFWIWVYREETRQASLQAEWRQIREANRQSIYEHHLKKIFTSDELRELEKQIDQIISDEIKHARH
jgi:hypothetical protein